MHTMTDTKEPWCTLQNVIHHEGIAYHSGESRLLLNPSMICTGADIKHPGFAASWCHGIGTILCIASSHQHLQTMWYLSTHLAMQKSSI